MITIFGVMSLATGCLLIYLYDNTFNNVLPSFVYLYMVLMMWTSSTMDALDGKHARNTNRSSPLGQLIDHGLDIFAYAFQLVYVCLGLRSGSTWIIFFLQSFTYVTI